jgi:hypothetical protein
MYNRVFPGRQPHHGLVDLTEPDGTKLPATYFAAGEPGPGMLLSHQCDP